MQNVRRIQNRNGSVSWQIDFTDKRGKRYRKSYSTRTAAKNALAYFHPKISNHTFTDPNKYENVRLEDLIEKYVSIYSKQRAFKAKRYFIKRIRESFDRHCLLQSITYADLQKFRDFLLETSVKKHPRSCLPDRKLTAASINRILACLRHMLRCAHEQWDMMPVNPFEGKPSLHLRENNEQDRYLSQDEIKRLLAVSPQHLQDVIIAAINSGMRRGELLPLKWCQIKWNDGIIELPETKSGKKQHVYLNQPLIDLFKRIRQREVVHSEYVFIWKNFWRKWQPIKDVRTAFKTACEKAGIKYGRPDGAVFHSLRHTYGSHLVMRGASIYEVRDLMRHSNVKMTQRYSHLSDKAKQAAAARLNGLTG